MATPNNYKDSFWSDLASAAEDKVGLPKGLLVSVLTNGERTNADKVSEAGAKTPFQIIPKTRQALIDKYGIDAYLNPQNAAEGAARLLKESLNRNGGDVEQAVGEYHGGTNRDNWGPINKAYRERVLSGLQGLEVDNVGNQGSSTFDKVSAAMKPKATTQLSAVYDAYKNGKMSPEEAADYEADVNAGKIMLPRGASLNNAEQKPATSGGAMVLPEAVATAYSTGSMSRQEMIDLERDVANGLVKLPEGTALQKTEPLGVIGGIKEAITGNERKTTETQMLPDWASMPELNSFSMASAKTGLGTLLSNPEETVQIIKANFPNVNVRQDDKGNFIMQSSIDGQEYAIKPGAQISDIPRAAGALAAFTPAGRAATIPGMAAGSAATQAAIEASQAATGGEFNPKEVAIAGATGAIVPAAISAVKAVAKPGQAALAQAMGREAPAAAEAAAPTVAPAAAAKAAPAPVAQAAEPLTAQELAQTAKNAAEGGIGSKKAMQTLAESATPNEKTVEAAKRLGIEDYLQPDHVTTNQVYRELAQAVKSVPGSEARAAETEGLQQVAKRADDLITEIGGSHDLSQVSSNIKQSIQTITGELENQANKLYKELRNEIPAQAEAPADNVLKFIKQRSDDLGGSGNLTTTEKMILKKLTPKEGKEPTYALLDDVRRDLTAARIKNAGPFKDADTGLIKKLESELKTDQAGVVEQYGMTETFKDAQRAVAIRKGFEDDLVSLFGKNLDGSIVGNLSGSVKALQTGDTSKFIKLIQSLPENMRQETVASGLATAFGKSIKQGNINFNSYAKWYEGLLKNKQAYAALMSNLPPMARKQLSDLYRVSKSIGLATKERITTGRIQAVKDELNGGDSLIGNIYSLAKRSAAGAASEAITTPLGMPGAGISASIASALAKGKPNALKAADALIASPEFNEAVKQAAKGNAKQAASKLAYTKPFIKFARAVGNPKELTNRERWIVSAITAAASNQNSKKD